MECVRENSLLQFFSSFPFGGRKVVTQAHCTEAAAWCVIELLRGKKGVVRGQGV